MRDIVPGCYCHHEAWDGSGYPQGLMADNIPVIGRVVAIADAYDAMTHDRPYKRAISHDAAIVELKQHAGTQFDPELVTLFCDLYTDNIPRPDQTVLAMTDPPIHVTRRERRTRFESASTETLASGAQGLVDLDPSGEAGPGARARRSDGPGKPPASRGIATG
jgi:hypothetical protein